MRQLYIVLALCFCLFPSCISRNKIVTQAAIKEFIETKYNANCDSLLILTTDDCYQTYIAANLVDDSKNLNWSVYGVQSKDSISFYPFFDFVKVVVEQCDNVDCSISILNKTMIEKDFLWQCTEIDSISFSSFYSMHALALVASNRKMHFFHSKDLYFNEYEAMYETDMKGAVNAWQKNSFGFSSSFILYRMRENNHKSFGLYFIKMEHESKYAYAVLLDLDKKYFFSLEDVCGIYSADSMQSYTKESFVRLMSKILSSSIPNSQKISWIKSIVEICKDLRCVVLFD